MRRGWARRLGLCWRGISSGEEPEAEGGVQVEGGAAVADDGFAVEAGGVAVVAELAEVFVVVHGAGGEFGVGFIAGDAGVGEDGALELGDGGF